MILNPSLLVRRLLVLQGSRPAYDATFHVGVNIVRGTNSSGKSSVLDLLAFSLGMDITDWTPEVKSCDRVGVEVEANGTVLSLFRKISSSSRREMHVFAGKLDEALQNEEQWSKYPYSQPPGGQSFSTAMFGYLEIPQVRWELPSQVTMHQLMRLVYVDQTTPASSVFRTEVHDNKLIRDAVGSLLCGAYDERLYTAEAQLRVAIAARDERKGAIRAITASTDASRLSPSMVESEINAATVRRSALYSTVEILREDVHAKLSGGKGTDLHRLWDDIVSDGKRVIDLQQEVESIRLGVEDSKLYIAALRQHLQAVEDAIAVKSTSVLGFTGFNQCPACFSAVYETDPNCCSLCKTRFLEQDGQSPLSHMKQEIRLQIDESELLQRKRMLLLGSKELEVSGAAERLERKRLTYRGLIGVGGLELDRAVIDREIGYLDRHLEDLARDKIRASSLDRAKEDVARLDKEIELLESERQSLRVTQEGRQYDAKRFISRLTAELLREDLPRETTFQYVQEVNYNFAEDRVAVDERTKFSASSQVILKNSFHLAILLASLRSVDFRYPRLLIVDNVEDKGMEESRSHNFQRLICRRSKEQSVRHQIIFSTSMIAPELDNPAYTAGKKTTLSDLALDIR
jgi:hypothetical protein